MGDETWQADRGGNMCQKRREEGGGEEATGGRMGNRVDGRRERGSEEWIDKNTLKAEQYNNISSILGSLRKKRVIKPVFRQKQRRSKSQGLMKQQETIEDNLKKKNACST